MPHLKVNGMAERENKILIIGAGLGGLALAQGLRKQGLKFEIFERDKDAAARSQGWVLSLHWILKDLLADVASDMPIFDTVSIGHDAGIEAEFAYYDATSGERQARFSHSAEKPLLRSDRGRVRKWLMHNIDIQWNKQLDHYSSTENGVRAIFTDGTFAEGSILVGADGVNSKVREQLMAGRGLKPRAIPLGNITCLVDLNEEQTLRQLQLAKSFYLAHSPNHRLFVGLRSIGTGRKSASFYWRLSWYDEAAKKEPYWTVQATPERLLEYVKESTQSFHPSMTEVLRASSTAGVVTPSLVFWDMLPVSLPLGRVTLIGDSIHPMSPFRGEGGNYAVADGLSLAKLLSRNDRTDGTKSATGSMKSQIPLILKKYEEEMLIRGSEGVLKSRDAAEDHKISDKESDKVNGEVKDNKSWLEIRIEKQAGDQGFKRL